MHKPEKIERTMTDGEIIKRLLKYLVPFKKEFLLSFIYMAFSIIVDLLPPLLIGKILDILVDSKYSGQRINYVIGFIAIFIVIIVVGLFAQYKQTMTLHRIGQRIVFNLRSEIFDHIEDLSIGQINEQPVGRLLTRVMNDTDSIANMFTSVVVNLIRSTAFMLVTLVILLIISIKLTLITLLVVPLFALSSYFFRRISRKSYRKIRDEISQLNSFLSENLSGMKVTQIFNQEEKKREEFQKRSKQLERNYRRQVLIFAVFRPSIYALSMAGLVAVLYFGATEVISGALTFGILYSFYSYVENFFNPIQNIAEEFNNLQDAYASAEKIFSILDRKPIIYDEPDAIELEEFKGHIEFKNVWFEYIPGEWVLKDISFEVKPDEVVAFVGSTGSGKTTILSLIVRNYDIQKGQILIDGIDIKKIKLASLRGHIGQMLQDVFLFNETVKNNITLNDPEIKEEDIIEAAEYVGVDTFINKLPENIYKESLIKRLENAKQGIRNVFLETFNKNDILFILEDNNIKQTFNIEGFSRVLKDSFNVTLNKDNIILKNNILEIKGPLFTGSISKDLLPKITLVRINHETMKKTSEIYIKLAYIYLLENNEVRFEKIIPLEMKEERIKAESAVITAERTLNKEDINRAMELVKELPTGYDHVVLERGNNFSSGQRQLISFARAVVYNPSLMILDEATANIDSETEELIQESLKKMMNISTMLIVAHRLSTIQHSDKIILLDKGEIKEMGSHQELLRHKGMYYDLYRMQFEEEESKNGKERNPKTLSTVT